MYPGQSFVSSDPYELARRLMSLSPALNPNVQTAIARVLASAAWWRGGRLYFSTSLAGQSEGIPADIGPALNEIGPFSPESAMACIPPDASADWLEAVSMVRAAGYATFSGDALAAFIASIEEPMARAGLLDRSYCVADQLAA